VTSIVQTRDTAHRAGGEAQHFLNMQKVALVSILALQKKKKKKNNKKTKNKFWERREKRTEREKKAD
jgi:hypothetical protein